VGRVEERVPPITPQHRRIGRVLQIRPETIHERVIRGLAEAPYANITIRTGVPREEFDYMRERPESFAASRAGSRAGRCR
jgi:CTP:phosphocholine cytidylyltransferase-like protein